MIYRNVRDKATGQWIDVVFSFQKADAQNVKAESHIADIAAALGVDPMTLEVADSDTDRRIGALIAIPKPAPTAADVTAQKRAEAGARAIAAIEANKAGIPWGIILQDLAVAQNWIES